MWHLTYEAVPSLPVTNTSLKTHVIEVAGYRWLVYILIAKPAGVRCDTLKHSSGYVVTCCWPFSCIMRKNLASLSRTANYLTHLILSVTFLLQTPQANRHHEGQCHPSVYPSICPFMKTIHKSQYFMLGVFTSLHKLSYKDFMVFHFHRWSHHSSSYHVIVCFRNYMIALNYLYHLGHTIHEFITMKKHSGTHQV